MLKTIKELYLYREMLRNLVKKDLRTRYKGSFLGFLWTFVNPLLQLIVYTLVFSTIMRNNIDKFAMYLFVGLIPWLFFNSSLIDSSSCILTNSNLIKKIYFPRIILPIATVNVCFMNMLFSFIIVFITLYFNGISLTINIIYLPIVMILQYFFAIGLSLIMSGVNVYFRDLQHILGIITMAWFYFTPIVYDISMIPERLLVYFNLNPMTHIIMAYRDILYYGRVPSFLGFKVILISSIIIMITGYYVFQKLQKGFAEEL